MNSTIWLADMLGATLVIHDNLGRYCDVANVFIRHRLIQIFLIKIEESLNIGVKIKL
jgi:hypothetical protein